MAHWSGEVEFDFVGDENQGNFVATGKVVPMLTQLLAAGNVEGAMRLYEGSNASVAAELLAQASSLSSVSQKHLGQMFLMARDFGSAAKVFEQGRRFGDAAQMHEKAGDFAAAARCYEKEGDLPHAAAALERSGQIDAALALYQRSQNFEAMAECLARQKRFFDAALVYQRLNNVRGEVEMLRLVPVTDPKRIEAVKRLGDLLERHGHLAPAAQLLVETLQQVQQASGDRELLASLIRRLEAMGKHEHANQVRSFAQKQLTSGSVAAPPKPNVPAAPAAAAAVAVAAAPAKKSGSGDPFDNFVDPFGGAVGPAAAAAPAPAPTPIPADPFDSFADPFQGGAQARANNDAYSYLKAIPIFGELALADMKDLYRICEGAAWQSGATVIEQGVQGKGLVVILAGSVQVLRVDGAKTLPLATLSAGSYVGEISLVDDAPTSARVAAQGEVKALFISRARFEQYLYTHEAAALKIYTLFTKTLAERLRQANKR